MSELDQRLQNELKTAMKEKNKVCLTTVRSLKALLQKAMIEKGSALSKEEELTCVRKSCKQRNDSIQQYENGGRDDLAKNERLELDILKAYLPAELEDEKLEEIIQKVIQKTGAQSMKEMGKVMGLAMKEVAGKADGNRVKKIVQQQLQSS